MTEKMKKITGLMLAIVMIGSMFPFSAASADTEIYTSNVIGPLVSEETEEDFGEPDPTADLETEEDFVASLKDIKLKGLPYNERLLAVAETQLGYSESESNFIVKENEAGKKEKVGYTRYGAWYGAGFEYESWCAMFISFCLHYAEVPEKLMPIDSGVITWIHKLQTMELYQAGREYLPKGGDFVFFDFDHDGYGDHMGIVTSVFWEDGVEMIGTIEGNHSTTVETFSYPRQSLEIMGYGVMSSELPEDEQEKQIFADYHSVDGNTYRVTMTYTPDAGIPDGSVVIVREILPSTGDYANYVAETEGALGWEEGSASEAIVLDISVYADGVEVQPAASVSVELSLLTEGEEDWNVVHFGEEAPQVLESTSEGDTVTFETEGFSIFVFAKAVIEKTLDASDGNTYKITVTYDSSAGIPDNADLIVTEIPEDSEEYKAYLQMAEDSLEAEMVSFARFFDITIVCDGKEVQPLTPVEVKIELDEKLDESAKALHFGEEEVQVMEASVSGQENADTEETKEEENSAANEIVFSAEGFSIYGVILTTLEKTITASDENTYHIDVTYTADAKIPAGADLAVEEILKEELPEGEDSDDSSPYDEYIAKIEDALGWEAGSASYVRLFDIRIINGSGEKVDIAAPVDVKIRLADRDSSDVSENTQVLHFTEESETGEVLDNVSIGQEDAEEGLIFSFEASGFSVYAIVEGPSPVPLGWTKVTSLDGLDETGFYIGHKDGYYFKGDTTAPDDNGRIGIGKTKPASSSPSSTAALYYFKKIDGTENQFYIYCKAGETKRYVYHGNATGNTSEVAKKSLSFTDDPQTKFTVSIDSNGIVKIQDDVWYWNMQSGANGTRFCSWNKADDVNAQFYIWNQFSPVTSDPYNLDGESYTLLTWDQGKTGKALTSDQNQNVTVTNNLCAEFLTVMTNNDNNELFVPNITTDEVTSWTFHWKEENQYKMEGTIYTRDGEGNQIQAGTKYLKIDDNGLSMVEEDNASLIQVIPGTGIHKGQIMLKSGNRVLTYSGTFKEGYNTNAGTGNEWLYLAKGKDPDELNGYFRTYTARQISVSDPSLSPQFDGEEPKKIIIYTRVWNGSGYKYFAIDGEGKMVPCSASGNEIEWLGSGLDELQWEFTEYGSWSEKKDEQGNPVLDEGVPILEFTPNGYYELKNAYTKKYLAPLIKADQILSDSTIGLNMNGRRNGQYYTPILSWDGPNYSYASIKADLDTSGDASIKPCYRAEGMDLYFAIVNELDKDDILHTVPTVDNNMYGITMKLVDFGPGTVGGSEISGTGCTTSNQQSAVLVNNKYVSQKQASGLLSTNLESDGYPTAVLSGSSLGTLYSDAKDVNHLFIESTYKATGYYEYDSAQNFASLKGATSGDFTVYQEIGTYDTSATDKWTLKHGQFFPYNDLQSGHFATTNGRNLYTPTGPLDSSDPRYNEQLYLVDDVNKYFGVELTAGFYQTPSGLDAWGHDIIFEFSGDDDFWLYVDGELVIDLGGIHSALPGSVNFRTGKVNVNNTQTTLLDLFIQNKVGRGEYADVNAAITALVYDPEDPNDSPAGKTFVKKVIDGETQYTFLDNTPHEMRIFYMERGAGASNLHMKFNLASVKRGSVQLSKEVDVNDVDMSSSVYATFPYQIWYKDPLYDPNADPNDNDNHHKEEFVQLTEQTLGNKGSVKYVGSTKEVTYKDKIYVDNINPDGVPCSVMYEGVYLVNPGETIEITFPIFGETGNEKYVTEYKVVECGVDPNVYNEVKLSDGTVLSPVPVNTTIRVDERDAHGDPKDDGIATIPEVYSGLCNYEIKYDSPDKRTKVHYINNAEETEELLIQKNLYKKEGDAEPVLIQKSELYDADGKPKDDANVHDLKTTFDFRVYFKTPYDAGYSPANVYEYHVKDPGGYYCKWHPVDSNSSNPNEEGSQGYFERITNENYPNGIKDFELLTEDPISGGRGEKSQATFDTSINGSVSQIPAYYTVEICGLIPGTQFKVVERPKETPKGYEFYQYELDGTVYSPDDPEKGVTGNIIKDNDSSVLVDNYKGFALHLYKTWADAATMKDRDPAYFAVYYETTDSGSGDISRVLVADSVRQLTYSADPQELNWFYLHLPTFEGVDTEFDNFVVREVTLAGDSIAVNNEGVVSGYTVITVVEDGDVMTLEGTGEDAVAKEKPYKVTYAVPEKVGTSLRKFRVTNTPSDNPGVKFLKEDWSDNPLKDASFTLTRGSTEIFTKKSDDDGLISIEYLSENTDYVLKETEAPQGYYGLQQDLTFQLVRDESSGWTLNVTPDTGDITDYYEVGFEQIKNEQGVVTEEFVTLTVRNRPYDFQVIKEDGISHKKLQGVKFELFEWKTVGEQGSWSNNPMTWNGSSDLATDVNGIIPHLDNSLPAGTYQLREKTPPSGYTKIDNFAFTISATGVITLENNPPTNVTLTGPEEGTGDQEGKFIYTITVLNYPSVKIQKTDENGHNLKGAKLELYKFSSSSEWALYNNGDIINGLIDLSNDSSMKLPSLPDGRYKLIERLAPNGYIILPQAIYFKVERTAGSLITLTDENGTVLEQTPDYVSIVNPSDSDPDPAITIKVKNTPGIVLPKTGGAGTEIFAAVGGAISALAGMLLVLRKKKRFRSS